MELLKDLEQVRDPIIRDVVRPLIDMIKVEGPSVCMCIKVEGDMCEVIGLVCEIVRST